MSAGGMECLRNALLPRRLTQMYADTKRSYEHVVRTNITSPQLSSLHLKLRIQKDRLVAWGLEWADSTAAQADDIDSSLDRAGISDLVASIMSSIRELLDEAERIQPHSRSQLLPGGFLDDKGGIYSGTNTHWTSADLARLGDIVKDITVSIDTLCDLSRSQQMLPQQLVSKSEKSGLSPEKSLVHQASPSLKPVILQKEEPLDQVSSSLTSLTRIDPARLSFPEIQPPGSSPPSYESVTSSSDHQAYAFLRALQSADKSQKSSKGIPVLVDYGSVCDTDPVTGRLPSLQRYEDLMVALQPVAKDPGSTHTGAMHILGWFVDPHRSRYAFVYEVPRSVPSDSTSLDRQGPPQSLLSFLQHGANADHNNMPCLEDRFQLAFQLASKLLHIHAKGITHRNVNSNNIFFVEDDTSTGSESMPWKEGVIRKPLLASFDTCAEDACTPHRESFISSIYRHPMMERGQRTGYKPSFDIYSLGIILLEVGLWMPIQQFWKAKYTRKSFKARLEGVYSKKLAGKCGKAYMQAVDYCLGVAHTTRERKQSNLQTDFYWNVLKPLERCCMIDASDAPSIVSETGIIPANATDHGAAAQTTVIEPRQSASPTMSKAENIPVNVTGHGVAAQTTVSGPGLSTAPTISETDKTPMRPGYQGPISLEMMTANGPTPKETVTANAQAQPGLENDLLIWPHAVPQSIQLYFNTEMMPILNRMFAKAIDRWESYCIEICMAGDTPESAKPTLLMECRSLMKAWRILQFVNKDRGLFEVQVVSGQLKYSMTKRKKSTKPAKYQQKPTCGASISCFVDEQNLQPVTFGGIVMVDGEPHGMSVHHMLEDPEPSPRSEDEEGFELARKPEIPGQLPGNFDQLDILEDFSSDEEERLLLVLREEEGEQPSNMGDTLGYEPGRGKPIVVTQPALDDVEPGFFPDENQMCEPHLEKHRLGRLYASSGLKRFPFEGIQHEVDWALIKIDKDRLRNTNIVEGGAQYCDKAAYPCGVLKANELGGLCVHAFGSTSGLATGKIEPALFMTRSPGRVFSSPMWRFKGDFGVGGDSGAWVIDNETGGACGHVTAYSEGRKYGTISPMEVLLQHMEYTLGKPVALPSVQGATARSFKQQLVFPDPGVIEEEGSRPAISGTELDNPLELRGGYLRSSFDSNYGPGYEEADEGEYVEYDEEEDEEDDVEEDKESVQGSDPSQSPPLATSPHISCSKLSAISLNNVAEQWSRSQAKMNLEGSSPVRGKKLGTDHMCGGLPARC